MKYKVLKKFSTILNGKKTTFQAGDVADLVDENIISECIEKGIIKLVPIMDTSLNSGHKDDNEMPTEKITLIKEVKKLKKKDDVFQYGEQMGITLDKSMKLDELKDIIIEHIENTADEDDVEYLTLEELQAFETEDELIGYGMSIGLEGLNDNFTRDELEDMICEYIENLKEAENEDL
ncbi:MAG: hypothetical protein ACK5K7_07395 [Bacilli bacterium]